MGTLKERVGPMKQQPTRVVAVVVVLAARQSTNKMSEDLSFEALYYEMRWQFAATLWSSEAALV